MANLDLPLLDAIKPIFNEQQIAWLDKSVNTLVNSRDIENDILNVSVMVKRKFGEATCELAGFEHFNIAEYIRLALLQIASEQLSIAKLAKHYYQFGDESEKCALLKGLPVLDGAGQAVETAIKACRCNSLVEFSAMAINNSYPAQFFPELNFNQLVLKS